MTPGEQLRWVNLTTEFRLSIHCLAVSGALPKHQSAEDQAAVHSISGVVVAGLAVLFLYSVALGEEQTTALTKDARATRAALERIGTLSQRTLQHPRLWPPLEFGVMVFVVDERYGHAADLFNRLDQMNACYGGVYLRFSRTMAGLWLASNRNPRMVPACRLAEGKCVPPLGFTLSVRRIKCGCF